MGIQLVGVDGTTKQDVDSLYKAARVSMRPIDVTNGGWYSIAGQSGGVTGVTGGSVLYAFRHTSATKLCMIRKVTMQVNTTTAFGTAQALDYDMIVARTYSVSESNGTSLLTLAGNNQKFKNTMATLVGVEARMATTAAIIGGTRTLDAAALNQIMGVSTGLNTGILTPQVLFAHDPEDMPLVLAQDEGFLIRNITTMGATGVVKLYITVEFAVVDTDQI